VFRDQPNAYQEALEQSQGLVDLTYSLGLTAGSDGKLSDVLWDGPAFCAELTVGDRITAVEGQAFEPDALRRAVAEAGSGPLSLVITRGKRVRDVTVHVQGGLRYPHLEPLGDTGRRLDVILRPR
jgi:predicted metalloprotease with PDZ domain